MPLDRAPDTALPLLKMCLNPKVKKAVLFTSCMKHLQNRVHPIRTPKFIMIRHLVLAFASCAIAIGAVAQNVTDIKANPTQSAYLQDGRGTIVRSPFGLCWRTGTWSSSNAVTGCDGELAPPVAKPTAPALVVTAPSPAAAPIAPKQCDFTVTLGSDQAFAFNRATLTPAAKKQLDDDVVGKLPHCAQVNLISVTGHADRLGSQQYNQRLSEKRAAAVAAYLKGKNVRTEVQAVGAGKTQPAKSCGDKLAHADLIKCLAPNRRVVIEVRGEAK